MWPETIYGPNVDADKLPICGGNLTVKVESYNEPSCCGRGVGMELVVTCSKCKHPWFPEMRETDERVRNMDGFDITTLIGKEQ